jgi:peptidoglycan/xylan/chitin deacetylase (PgdA/CDA1 family)
MPAWGKTKVIRIQVSWKHKPMNRGAERLFGWRRANSSHLPALRELWSFGRDALGAAVHWSGAGRAFEMAARPAGAIILMYHSVAENEAAKFIEPPNRISPPMFDRQMAFLREHRRVVPLSQLVDDIACGKSPPAGTVCITFDDGYRDNLTTAAPILEKHKLPATLFLATGYVERAETQWSDTLHWLLAYATRYALSLPSLGLPRVNFASPAEKAAAGTLLHAHLLESDHEHRVALLAELERQLAPAGEPPRLTMNWDEVRELRRRYPLFEIGGHTRDHIDLREHCGEAAQLQIAGCAQDLRRELGLTSRHFSFPYERWCAETRSQVIAAGWISAVGMGKGPRIAAGSDRFAMPRVQAPRTMTQLRFKTSGAYPGALAMLGLR